MELAGEYWTVLICKEAVDEWGNDCGSDGLTLYANGTLTPFKDQPRFHPKYDFYKHYKLGDSVKDEHVATAMGIIEAFEPPKVNSSLADWIRRRAEAAWPTDYWNVLVELSPGNSYFFGDEQLHLADVNLAEIKFTIFDRQCQSPMNDDRVLRHARPRHAPSHPHR